MTREMVKVGRCWIDPERVEAVEGYHGGISGDFRARITLTSGTQIHVAATVDEVMRILGGPAGV